MPAYFDSSILISILKNDADAVQAAQLWEENAERVGSILLEAECLVVLRRLAEHFRGKLPQKWLSSREQGLTNYLEEIDLRNLDAAILEIIRGEKALSQCRTLDALHVASALYFQRAGHAELRFFSFDGRMNQVARRVGFNVLDVLLDQTQKDPKKILTEFEK